VNVAQHGVLGPVRGGVKESRRDVVNVAQHGVLGPVRGGVNESRRDV